MKIAVFGCSWSYGVPSYWSKELAGSKSLNKIPKEDYVNWTRELGKMRPDWEIYNYSVPGSSMFFSCSMLERVLAEEKFDLHIFQATSHNRFVYWKDPFYKEAQWTNTEPNVYQFAESNLKNINIVSIHNWKTQKDVEVWSAQDQVIKKDETKFARMYYSKVSEDMWDSEYRIFADFAKNNSDIFFSHLDYKFLGCDTVQGTLANKKFAQYSIDNGYHFGYEGCRWQAKWVLDKINTI